MTILQILSSRKSQGGQSYIYAASCRSYMCLYISQNKKSLTYKMNKRFFLNFRLSLWRMDNEGCYPENLKKRGVCWLDIRLTFEAQFNLLNYNSF